VEEWPVLKWKRLGVVDRFAYEAYGKHWDYFISRESEEIYDHWDYKNRKWVKKRIQPTGFVVRIYRCNNRHYDRQLWAPKLRLAKKFCNDLEDERNKNDGG
jgi:hypothetical protein